MDDFFASLIGPQCLFCTANLGTFSAICDYCEREVEKTTTQAVSHLRLNQKNVTYIFRYEGWLKSILPLQKQNPSPAFVQFAAFHLHRAIPSLSSPLIFVPAHPLEPSHWLLLLKDELKKLGHPVLNPNPIHKDFYSLFHGKQKSKKLAERKQNRFSLKKEISNWPDLHQQQVTVIDDVLTTGNTLSECCQLLETIGVQTNGVVLAATPPPQSNFIESLP